MDLNLGETKILIKVANTAKTIEAFKKSSMIMKMSKPELLTQLRMSSGSLDITLSKMMWETLLKLIM